MDQVSAVQLVKELAANMMAAAEAFATKVAGDGAAMDPITGTTDRSLATARQLLAERTARRDYLPASLFDEFAWTMLLALFAAREENRAMSLRALTDISEAPPTTAQRSVDKLVAMGFVSRTDHPLDRRKVDVALSDAGHDAMLLYLKTIRPATQS